MYTYLQAVRSASFYGASYAAFPAIEVGINFAITFSFKTAFSNGLLMFTGNASQVSGYTYIHVHVNTSIFLILQNNRPI